MNQDPVAVNALALQDPLVVVVGDDRQRGVGPDGARDAVLHVCTGPDAGRRLRLADGTIIVGRGDGAHVRLDDDRASSGQALIARQGNVHRVRGVGLSGLLLVNERRVEDVELRDRDVVRVGGTILQYRIEYLAERTVFDDDPGPSIDEIWRRAAAIVAIYAPYRLWIVAFLVLGALGGFASFVHQPPSRLAYFEISLAGAPSENPVQRFEREYLESFRAAEQNFRSAGLIERTLASLGRKDASDGYVDAVQQQLSFVNVGSLEAPTYVGAYRGATPEESLAFLRSHVQLYLDAEAEKVIRVLRVERDFLVGQERATRAEMREAEQELLAFKKANVDGQPETARRRYDELFDLQRREVELGARSSRDDPRASMFDVVAEGARVGRGPYHQELFEVNRRIAAGRAGGLGEQHPDMVRMRAEADALAGLAAANPSGDDSSSNDPRLLVLEQEARRARAEAEGRRREAARVRAEVERARATAARLPDLEVQYAALAGAYESARALHARIAEQLRAASLQLELERATTTARYDIITAPRLEYVATERVLMKRVGVWGTGGLAAGIALASLRLLRRGAFKLR